MTYDFSRLGPDGFEQLVQALALASIGGRVRIFGDGRDGGREATFNGDCSVPGGGDWTGYGVIQAKFKSRITSTALDQSWFFAEATKELDAWVGRGRKTRRVPSPEYLVFATNVVLTPVNQIGGADRFEQLMVKYRDLTEPGGGSPTVLKPCPIPRVGRFLASSDPSSARVSGSVAGSHADAPSSGSEADAGDAG